MELPAIDLLWDYQDPAASEQRFREVLPRARASLDDTYTVELLTQIARAVCLQRDFQRAHHVLDDAEALLTPGMQRPRVRCLLERGRILNDTSQTAEALRHFKDAWEIAERSDERLLAADALHMIAYVSEGKDAIRWHLKAIEYCENNEGERFRRWLTSLYMNIADKYEERQEFDEALACVTKCLEICQELKLEDRVLDSKCFLARLHRLKGDVSHAMELLHDLLPVKEARGYVFEEHAECLLLLEREHDARAEFKKAYERLSHDPWYPPTEVERLERIKRLAGL